VKPGDLVKPSIATLYGRVDPRVLGVLVDKHEFYPECWNVYWRYTDRPSGVGAAYEESLEVLNESR